MHAFYQNAVSFELLYIGFVSCNIQILYMQTNQLHILPILGFYRFSFFFFFFFFLFLQDMRNENPTQFKRDKAKLIHNGFASFHSLKHETAKTT